MSKRLTVMIWLGLFAVGVGGCATVPSEESSGLPASQATPLSDITVKDLAGIWEYEEASAVYSLTLDHEGKGNLRLERWTFFDNQLFKGSVERNVASRRE